jgi:monoamine oxidase
VTHTPLFSKLVRILQLARRANLEVANEPPVRMCDAAQQSRRRFLKTTVLAGTAGLMGTALLGTARRAWASGSGHEARVAIVGAGLAGLNAAYQLHKAGIRAMVYEASSRLGGRVWSRTGLVGDGLVTEIGAEFINTNHEDMLALARDFDLPLFNRHDDAARFSFPESGYFFGGTAWREDELADLLRPLAAQITRDADLIDKNWDRFAPRFDALSVSHYLDQHARKIRAPFIRTLFENAIRTEYGVEPQESSALQLLFLLPTVDGDRVDLLGYSDEAFTVEGGNGRIVEGLGKVLADQIHLQMPLVRLEAHHHDGSRLTFGNGESIEADYVVMAIPFTTLRNIDLKLPLPNELRAFIHEVDLGANEKLMAGFTQRVWRHAQGFVGEAWTDLGFSEVWDGSQRQAKRDDAVLTYFLGGNEVAAAERSSAASEVGREFTHRLSAFAPGLDAAATGKFARTGWTQNPLTHGAYTSFKPGQLTRFGGYLWVESDVPAEQQEVRVGRLLFAGEQVSDEYYGFMNGAAQTGRLAAQVVQRELEQSTTKLERSSTTT